MAGEFLPPVVTVLEADISDLVAKVAEAKALIDSISNSKIEIKVSVTGIAGPVAGAIAQIEALKAAMAGLDNKTISIGVDGLGTAAAASAAAGAAGGGRGGGRGIWWLGGLGLLGIHNLLLVLGSQIIADTAGFVAFGVAAAATLGPVFSGYSTLQTSYATLDNYQKGAALSLNHFLEGFQNANEAGVVTVFNEGLAIVNDTLHHTGSITTEATQAFIQFGAMLHTTLTGSGWQSVFGAATHNVRDDMTALFGLINSLVGAVPALMKDFNGFGLTAIHAVTGVISAFDVLSNNVIGKAILRFGALGISAYKSLGWLDKRYGLMAKLGGAVGISEGGAVVGAGVVGLGIGALATEFYYLSKLQGPAEAYQNFLIKQNPVLTQTTQGWLALSIAMGQYARAQATVTYGVRGPGGTVLPMGRLGVAQMIPSAAAGAAVGLSAQDAQNAKIMAQNLTYLANAFGMSNQQARQFAATTGVSLIQPLQGGSKAAQQARFELQAYVATVRGAASPTSVLGVQMMLLKQDAGNLTKQGQDLTAMFNTLATPFANVISNTVTWKQGNIALAQAVKQSGDRVGYATARQRTSAQALATAITNTEGLSSAILQNTGSVSKSFGPLQQEISFLKSLHSNSTLVAQAIKILQQYIDQLHSKTVTVTVWAGITGPGAKYVTGAAGGNAFSPGGTKRVASGNASGTQSFGGGWSWVGERGPELVNLPGGSRVIPNHLATGTGGGMGGGDIHVYIDGKEVFGAVKARTYGYNTQNGNRRKGGGPRGTLAPRG